MSKRKQIYQTRSSPKIALYIRVSTEEQADNPEGSIKSQEQRLRSHVEYRNTIERPGEIVAVFTDRAKSGKDMSRSELQRMLTAITRGEITHVLVTELSRLSRNVRDFLEMWELMEQAGCQFQSLREQVDTSTAAGRMVINSMMNFAQFEREQVAERVTANLIARSMRGLYNGGIVPVGYKTIADKKGYLAIDEEMAPTIRTAFKTFLQQETLTSAATWLNAHGYRIPRQMRNGGGKPRLGYFTIDNLHFILRNKAYAGIKTHKVKGEVRQAKAVWEPIVDAVTFDRVQALLSKNHCQKKPISQKNRYPFWLAGLVHCGSCGDRLSGKSAHGNGGKVPYYEHAWATKRQACLVKKVFDCKPNRILAKKLEPLVWSKVEELLRDPRIAQALVAEAKANYETRTQGDTLKRIREKVQAFNNQLEALAERVAVLPKSVPAEPFYRQMEKIQALKNLEEERQASLETDPVHSEMPTSLPAYEALLTVLDSFAEDPIILENRIKIIQRLIYKIEIRPGTYRLHFHIGKNYIDGELAHAGSLFLCPNRTEAGQIKPQKIKKAPGISSRCLRQTVDASFFKFLGSKSLTNGWGARIRT